MHTPQIEAKIISNNKITKNYYLLRLDVPHSFKDAQPGQFVHVRINNTCEPLLRRPFSIHNLTPIKTKSNQHGFHLDVLYELKGKGTNLLSEKKAEGSLDIIGPLGKGFNLQPQNTKDQINIIIAGGAGVAPLFFLANTILHNKKSKVIVLIGASTSTKILKEKELRDLGCEVDVATEDGTSGRKGKVVALFENIISRKDIAARIASKAASINVYACGPKAMLTALAKTCMIKKIMLQVSLEEFMGCGIGACLGCAIETKSGYQRVCCDGPVFDAQDIVWKF